MATGSGKTRTVIALVDVLLQHGWVKNVLFLANRNSLVTQAKRSFVNLLPELSVTNLCEEKDNFTAHCVFSTYQTMMNCIDSIHDAEGKLFTCGHFDMIICDEAHRSIYNKYRDIFHYFDAPLVGLTATPKDEIDKNTYEIFDLENGVPTYGYELAQAVKDGFLVDFLSVESEVKFMKKGITYDELSDEEREAYENTFEDENGNLPASIDASALNSWLFNKDTIRQVLNVVMQNALKIDYGSKIGKTIIFAKNTPHAKKIVERFNTLFPEYGGDFIKQVDYSIKYADTLIDDFGTKERMPQIAVSVDMLDTGIDVPEILNLVFFKKVRSYAKFWQMIGRGTRLCKDLLGEGMDKERFLIFDFCNNFEYFRVNKNGSENGIQESLCEKIYNAKAQICRELQASQYVMDADYAVYRKELVMGLNQAVIELNDDSFVVKRHLRYVEMFRKLSSWNQLETIEISEIKEHIAPLMKPKKENELARRFDYLIYSIDLGLLQSKSVQKPIQIVMTTAEQLSKVYRLPQVAAKKEMNEKVQETNFWDDVTVVELDKVREALRDLLQYLEHAGRRIYYTDFTDEITDRNEGEPIYASVDLKNYRKKVEFYLRDHKGKISVFKLRHNKRLTEADLKELEEILWKELGTKADYEKEYGDTPVGRLVRQIVGVDREAVNEAFSEFLTEERLNVNQIRFVRLIVDYIVANGNIDDNRVLMDEPFRSAGSITALFKDDMDSARKIMSIVDSIKRNSEETA